MVYDLMTMSLLHRVILCCVLLAQTPGWWCGCVGSSALSSAPGPALTLEQADASCCECRTDATRPGQAGQSPCGCMDQREVASELKPAESRPPADDLSPKPLARFRLGGDLEPGMPRPRAARTAVADRSPPDTLHQRRCLLLL